MIFGPKSLSFTFFLGATPPVSPAASSLLFTTSSCRRFVPATTGDDAVGGSYAGE